MSDPGHKAAVRLITESLKGPVAEVFRGLIPAFASLTGEQLYETVMDSGDLLHGFLLIFEKRRDRFRHLLVDAEGREVHDDFVRLRCGRSLHEVTAMLVRTHAKRHFRSTLGDDPNDPRSRAGRLYNALNEYLIHQWQVPLVAHYAPLPPETVERLGPAILDLRDAESLEDLRAGATRRLAPPVPAGAAARNPPAALTGGTPSSVPLPALAVASRRSRDEDYWWETLYDPLVRAALAIASETEMREMVPAFVAIGEATRTKLLAGLQLSMPQAAVVLTTIYRAVGRASFLGIFGTPGSPAAVANLATGLGRKLAAGHRHDLKGLRGAVEAVVGGSRPSAVMAR